MNIINDVKKHFRPVIIFFSSLLIAIVLEIVFLIKRNDKVTFHLLFFLFFATCYLWAYKNDFHSKVVQRTDLWLFVFYLVGGIVSLLHILNVL